MIEEMKNLEGSDYEVEKFCKKGSKKTKMRNKKENTENNHRSVQEI